MPLKSDVVIDASKFDPANNSEQANKLNQYLLSVGDKGPAWYEVRSLTFLHGSIAYSVPGRSSKVPGDEMERRKCLSCTNSDTKWSQFHYFFSGARWKYPVSDPIPFEANDRGRPQTM
jgi:hypothetical protein